MEQKHLFLESQSWVTASSVHPVCLKEIVLRKWQMESSEWRWNRAVTLVWRTQGFINSTTFASLPFGVKGSQVRRAVKHGEPLTVWSRSLNNASISQLQFNKSVRFWSDFFKDPSPLGAANRSIAERWLAARLSEELCGAHIHPNEAHMLEMLNIAQPQLLWLHSYFSVPPLHHPPTHPQPIFPRRAWTCLTRSTTAPPHSPSIWSRPPPSRISFSLAPLLVRASLTW